MKKISNFTIRIIATLMAVATLSTSCLDKEPGYAIPESEAMHTFNDAEQTLVGIYAMMKSSALWSGYLTLLPDIQCDLVYAIDGYSNTYGSFWQWDIRSTSSEIESVYAALYNLISNCNFYLENVDRVRQELVDDSLIATLDCYTGEIYAIRALCYSELIKCFCKAYDPATAEQELGVVIRSKYAESEPLVRASLYDSYQFVLRDLDEAEARLAVDDDYASAVFFTNATVCALRARIALYMQDWEAAIDYSSRLIDHPNRAFSLQTTRNATLSQYSDFDYMWLYDAGPEVIFRIGFTNTSYGGALGQVFLGFTTDYYYFYPDYVVGQSVIDLYDDGDGRYSSYFSLQQTGYDHALQWPLLVKYYGNVNFIESSYIYHVSMPKLFRLGEQYLIRAEAYCRQEKPNFAQAAKDLQTLRAARYVSGGGINLTAENFMQQLSDERVRELFMEGFRLQDLKRWGNLLNNGEGFTRTPQSNSLIEGSSLSIKADNPLFVWPIPQHELESPGSSVEPNESNN